LSESADDLKRRLREGLESLPVATYRRVCANIMGRLLVLYGARMDPVLRTMAEATLQVARAALETSTRPVESAVDLAGRWYEWYERTNGVSGVYDALVAFEVYAQEIAGEYPPYATCQYITQPFLAYPDVEALPSGLVGVGVPTGKSVDSPAGRELQWCLRAIEAGRNGSDVDGLATE
jgi:hypothetical protein